MTTRSSKGWNRRLSPSACKLFEECAFRFWATYIKRFKPDVVDKSFSVLGTAVHAVIAQMYEKELFDLDYLLEIYPSLFDKIVKKEKAKFNSKMGMCKKQGPKILKTFFKFAKKYHLLKSAVCTERYFRIPYRGIFLTGKIDLIIKLVDGRTVVFDWKTSKYELTKAQAKKDMQLTFYSWACRILLKIKEDVVAFFYLRSGNVAASERNREDFKKLAKRVMGIAKEIKKEQFEPNFDNCRYCDHKKLCLKTFGPNKKRDKYL